MPTTDLRGAIELIAAYVVGRRSASHEELARACRVVHSDPNYLRYLQDELGLHGEWVSECDVFESRVAEFSEMSAAERAAEVPELVAHVEACSSCRQTYWDVRESWIRSVTQTGRMVVQRLGESIRMAVDDVGRLLQLGLGPPESTIVPVFATLDAPDADDVGGDRAPTPKEWVLRDREAGCAIRLLLRGQPANELTLGCSVDWDEPARIETGWVRIEVHDATTRSMLLSGPLSTFRTQPISLRPGSWIVRVETTVPTQRAWEIPLEIEAGVADSSESAAMPEGGE